MEPFPVAVASTVIQDYVRAHHGVINPGELAHQVLAALGLDHTLPVVRTAVDRRRADGTRVG